MANSYIFQVSNGKMEPSLVADLTNLPSADQKAGLAGISSHEPTASNPVVTKSYIEGMATDWLESVAYEINYIHTAVPSAGTPTDGEKLYNSTDQTIYQYVTDTWTSLKVLVSGDRFVFKTSGTETVECGTYTADDKVREYNGTSIVETTPTKGAAFNYEPDNDYYSYNGTNWVYWGTPGTPSVGDHNDLTNIQGGTTSEYYHLTSDQQASVTGATTPSASNVVQTEADKVNVPVPYKFVLWNGVGQSQTNKTVYDCSGVLDSEVMYKDGSIVGLIVKSTSACTAGTLTVKPRKNGSAAGNAALDLVLNSTTNTTKNTASTAIATTGLTFAAGDELGVAVTSSADWAAGGSENISVTLLVVFG